MDQNENRQKFTEAWNNGVPVKEMAVMFGIKPHSVTTRALKNPECKRRKRSKLDTPEFPRMWNRGVSTKEIAKRFGLSEAHVRAYARNDPRCKERGSKMCLETFVKMWNGDKSLQKIAKKFNTSEGYVINFAGAHRDLCKKRKKILNHEEILTLRKEGLEPKEIAKQMQICLASVYIHLRRERNG